MARASKREGPPRVLWPFKRGGGGNAAEFLARPGKKRGAGLVRVVRWGPPPPPPGIKRSTTEFLARPGKRGVGDHFMARASR